MILGQLWENIEINPVVRERLRILAEANSVEPLRDVVGHGALLRQAGFAEAVEEPGFILRVSIGKNALRIRDTIAGRLIEKPN